MGKGYNSNLQANNITDPFVRVNDFSEGGAFFFNIQGGYNLSALGRSVVAHIKALADL